jgi:hypothetical protein
MASTVASWSVGRTCFGVRLTTADVPHMDADLQLRSRRFPSLLGRPRAVCPPIWPGLSGFDTQVSGPVNKVVAVGGLTGASYRRGDDKGRQPAEILSSLQALTADRETRVRVL